MFRDDGLDQGRRTYGTRHSQLSQFFLFILPNQRISSEEYVWMYVCTHTTHTHTHTHTQKHISMRRDCT